MFTSPKTLTSLPPELLSLITAQLRHCTSILRALSGSCKQLRQPARDVLLEELTIGCLEEFFAYHISGTRSPDGAPAGKLSRLEQAGAIHAVKELNLWLIPKAFIDVMMEETEEGGPVTRPDDIDIVPLHYVADLLHRLPGLRSLNFRFTPYLSIPAPEYSRLRLPLQNLSTMIIEIPPWDHDHSFLRQIAQLTPQLEHLGLRAHANRRFQPCSSPLPPLSKLSRLSVHPEFYLSLGKLNLFTPSLAAQIRSIEFASRDQTSILQQLPEGYASAFGNLFGTSVTRVDLIVRGEGITQLETSMLLPHLKHLRLLTLDEFSDEEFCFLSSLPSSCRIVEFAEARCDPCPRIVEFLKKNKDNAQVVEGLRDTVFRTSIRVGDDPVLKVELLELCAHYEIKLHLRTYPQER